MHAICAWKLYWFMVLQLVLSKFDHQEIMLNKWIMLDIHLHFTGLVCCFLHVHPTGASLDYIWSYLHRLGVVCRASELETLLEKMSVIFKLEVSGVGATIERRWHFTGYKGMTSSSMLMWIKMWCGYKSYCSWIHSIHIHEVLEFF